jgi:hypothetical protein
MKLKVSKTRVITFSRKTNGFYYVYKTQDSSITSTDASKDLGVLLDSKLRFRAQVDYIFSQSLKTLHRKVRQTSENHQKIKKKN